LTNRTCPTCAPYSVGLLFADDAGADCGKGSSTGGTYTYDGNGLRVSKSASSTTTVYLFSGSKVVAEYDNGAAPSSPSREYIYLSGALLAKIESGATVYFHRDHLSNRVLTDSSGNILGQRGHYPFGETWYESGTTTKFKFATYERDSESTNDYARARSYADRFGRFASPDSVESAKGQNAQGLNRYPYVTSDPVNLTDPSGQFGGPGGRPFFPFLEGPGDAPPGNCYLAEDFAQIGFDVPICFPDGGGEGAGGDPKSCDVHLVVDPSIEVSCSLKAAPVTVNAHVKGRDVGSNGYGGHVSNIKVTADVSTADGDPDPQNGVFLVGTTKDVNGDLTHWQQKIQAAYNGYVRWTLTYKCQAGQPAPTPLQATTEVNCAP
jgi:RHS repeat-associated protein